MARKDAPVQFHTNVHRTWKTAIAQCDADLLVFSPYLTSRIAESVMGGSKKVQIHTVFDVENFASGASSLRTLRTLINAGHDLYHVPKLHAKIVLDPHGFVSLGSQNITAGGLRNLEMSATFHTDAAAQEVFAQVEPWLQQREVITIEMIDELEALFEPARVLFEKAQTRAAELQREFEQAQEVRARKAARLQREAEEALLFAQQEERRRHAADRAARLAALQLEIASRERSTNEAYTWIQKTGEFVHSLVTHNGVDLTRWWVGDVAYDLEPLHRYLCIAEDSGRLGWARVAKTRITYIAPSLELSRNVLIIGGIFYGLRLTAETTPTVSGANLRITLKLRGILALCVVTAWYTPNSLTILSIQDVNEASSSDKDRAFVRQWLQDNTEAFSRTVRRHIVQPFKYVGNLYGEQAHTFFGDDRFRLRVVLEGNSPVLVASKLNVR